MNDFAGKVAIVTGATRGVGRAIALALGARGATVAFNYLSRDDLASALVSEIERVGGKAKSYAADVADASAVEAMVEDVRTTFGGLDILVNNAGITRDKLVLRMETEDWGRVIGVNLSGAFYFAKEAAPIMVKARRGAILNITSVSGLAGLPGQANYSAAKAGLVGLTKSLARELGKRNVRVNALALGYIETDMTHGLADEYKQRILDTIALARFGKPEDVADVALFLLSDAARYVTGEVIRVDGGLAL
ncbi:MAG: 3-oxoacyl-[acyl-carrier-protein] reductase [bacterium]